MYKAIRDLEALPLRDRQPKSPLVENRDEWGRFTYMVLARTGKRGLAVNDGLR
jgi:hypothetical protein